MYPYTCNLWCETVSLHVLLPYIAANNCIHLIPNGKHMLQLQKVDQKPGRLSFRISELELPLCASLGYLFAFYFPSCLGNDLHGMVK